MNFEEVKAKCTGVSIATINLGNEYSLTKEVKWLISEVEKMNQLKSLDEEIALKSIINHALHLFPKSFINNNNEFILIPKYNHFFSLNDVDTVLIFKCKMFEWLSRPISKSLPKRSSGDYLYRFNYLLKTNFTKEEMGDIYTRLGNSCNRPLTIKFIESGYDMGLLEYKQSE